MRLFFNFFSSNIKFLVQLAFGFGNVLPQPQHWVVVAYSCVCVWVCLGWKLKDWWATPQKGAHHFIVHFCFNDFCSRARVFSFFRSDRLQTRAHCVCVYVVWRMTGYEPIVPTVYWNLKQIYYVHCSKVFLFSFFLSCYYSSPCSSAVIYVIWKCANRKRAGKSWGVWLVIVLPAARQRTQHNTKRECWLAAHCFSLAHTQHRSRRCCRRRYI